MTLGRRLEKLEYQQIIADTRDLAMARGVDPDAAVAEVRVLLADLRAGRLTWAEAEREVGERR